MTTTSTLVVANFDEALSTANGKSTAVPINPLALVRGASSYVLARLDNEASWIDFGGDETATFSIRDGGEGLSRALLRDTESLGRLADLLSRSGRVDLRFQVWSDALEQLMRRLSDDGVVFDTSGTPSVSGSTVAFWNTKRGGREVLATVPELRSFLPALRFCRSLDDAERALAAMDRACVLKPNVALGGAGIVFLQTAAELPAWASSGGLIVEELVGDPRSNVSPTADFLVTSDTTQLLGIGLQILERGVAYAGVRNLPKRAAYRQQCVDVGGVIGTELARRGYRGPLNVDFVVTKDGQVVVAEINVRQSAPLEAFAAVQHRYGSGWQATSFLCSHVLQSGPNASGAAPIDLPAGIGTWADHAAILGQDRRRSASRHATLLASSASSARVKLIAKAAGDVAGVVNRERTAEPLVARSTKAGRDTGSHIALARRMRKVAARFRSEHPLSPPKADTGSYAIPINWGGVPEAKPIAWFASPGCAWSLAGGCTMCDFSADEAPLTVAEATTAFKRHLERLDPDTRRIHLGPGGSFFDDREVPAELRAEVLRACAVLPSLRSVGLETRPSLVSFERLLHAVGSLPPNVADLTLGFGLECLDPLVREVAINKGYDTNHIDRAIEVIERVNGAQSHVRVDFEIYVLLKPLFVTEREAIDEALRTIKWSFGRGATTVAMFLNTIKRNTIQGYLASRADLDPPYRFEAPYYRTAVEVLRRLPPTARSWTVVLGTQSGVMAEGQPSGCDLCTPLMLGALMGYNFTRENAILEEAARSWCPCREDWERSVRVEALAIPQRIEHGISILEAAFPDTSVPPPLRRRHVAER